jgi:phosphonopyruvate decarboxylase
MINAARFLQELGGAGCKLISGVPCINLRALIDAAIAAPEFTYIGAANEGDAVAIACGSELGGRTAMVLLQNSGLGNAVNPLASLAATFKIPLLLLVSWRGQPGAQHDEPEHDLMGPITPAMLELMDIPWEELPHEDEQIGPALQRAMRHMRDHRTPYALVAPRGIFAEAKGPTTQAIPPVAFSRDGTVPQPVLEPIDCDAALAALQAAAGPRDVLLATTGFTGRALYGVGDRPNQLYMVGSMGCVSSLALGLAFSRPDHRIIAIDGDGALLMRMGALATIGSERPPNLVHIVLDNGVHDSTGSQATVAPVIDLPSVAAACGYASIHTPASPDELKSLLTTQLPGPAFVHVRTWPRGDRQLPRPTISPPEVADRLRAWLADPA